MNENSDNDNNENDNKTLILHDISNLGSLIGALYKIQSTGYFIVTFKIHIYVQPKTFSEHRWVLSADSNDVRASTTGSIFIM